MGRDEIEGIYLGGNGMPIFMAKFAYWITKGFPGNVYKKRYFDMIWEKWKTTLQY